MAEAECNFYQHRPLRSNTVSHGPWWSAPVAYELYTTGSTADLNKVETMVIIILPASQRFKILQ